MANHYDVPSWAGRSPTGHHLDVTKDEKLIQKLMIDDKKCYLFGRNPHLNDFCIDHNSCSRVHAALVYHKQLNISYLVDLGSTHGTFIGTLRIEARKPTQLQINSTFHFGASTRYYTLRERPSAGSRSGNIMEDLPMNESGEGALLGLPESQTELDNLTEYNTALNRRISMLGITEDTAVKKNASKSKRPRRGVTFNDEEIVINPEDIDPAVGRFRNLIQTTVVPTKRMKIDMHPLSAHHHNSSAANHHHHHLPMGGSSAAENLAKQFLSPSSNNSSTNSSALYHDLPPTADADTKSFASELVDLGNAIGMGSKFGIILPNPAPEVETVSPQRPTVNSAPSIYAGISPTKNSAEDQHEDDGGVPRKKKYAKEAWPGRKPLLTSF